MAYGIADNFDRLPENVQNLLFKLADNKEAARGVAYAVSNNFDRLPENIRNKLLIKLADNDNKDNELLLKIADNKDAAIDVAFALASLERYDKAIVFYNKAIEINPNCADAWYNKGAALFNLARYEDAIKSYEEAIRIKPDDADAWYNKGAALFNLARYEDAIKCFEEIIKIKPDDADAWYNIALSNVKKGDIGKGLSDLKKAIEAGWDTYITYAREDQDFNSIRNIESFKRSIVKIPLTCPKYITPLIPVATTATTSS